MIWLFLYDKLFLQRDSMNRNKPKWDYFAYPTFIQHHPFNKFLIPAFNSQ